MRCSEVIYSINISWNRLPRMSKRTEGQERVICRRRWKARLKPTDVTFRGCLQLRQRLLHPRAEVEAKNSRDIYLRNKQKALSCRTFITWSSSPLRMVVFLLLLSSWFFLSPLNCQMILSHKTILSHDKMVCDCCTLPPSGPKFHQCDKIILVKISEFRTTLISATVLFSESFPV